MFASCFKHRTAVLTCKGTYMPTRLFVHPGSSCQGFDGQNRTLAGPRAIVIVLLDFSSSTILTPTASPRAKTPGIHSWMGLLGSPRAWLYHRHFLQLYLPFYSCKFCWYFLFQLTPVSVLWFSVTKTSGNPGRQRSFFPQSPSVLRLRCECSPKVQHISI